MPRAPLPARLWRQPEQRTADGRLLEHATWVILDRGKKTRTGCREDQRQEAEARLAEHLATKRVARAGKRDPSQILVADVLSLYATEKAVKHRHAALTQDRIATLLDHFGLMTLAEIKGSECRSYVAKRGSESAARRELEDLRAAINYHRKEGLCSEIVGVWLPEKPVARERWLTRSEAARLIWGAWRYREVQKGHPTGRHSRRDIARFILVGLYTGTRSGAIVGAALSQMVGRGWIDLERGVFYRRAAGARETKKKQPPVRLPGRLLAHLRRWRTKGGNDGKGQRYVVEWNGAPIGKVKKAFARAAEAAGLGEVTPHTLRHTAATWLMQAGVDPWEAAGYLGMTVETLTTVYGHHHPDYQNAARAAFDRR
jgi:integrase